MRENELRLSESKRMLIKFIDTAKSTSKKSEIIDVSVILYPKNQMYSILITRGRIEQTTPKNIQFIILVCKIGVSSWRCNWSFRSRRYILLLYSCSALLKRSICPANSDSYSKSFSLSSSRSNWSAWTFLWKLFF